MRGLPPTRAAAPRPREATRALGRRSSPGAPRRVQAALGLAVGRPPSVRP
jgi:hypothetical protein